MTLYVLDAYLGLISVVLRDQVSPNTEFLHLIRIDNQHLFDVFTMRSILVTKLLEIFTQQGGDVLPGVTIVSKLELVKQKLKISEEPIL